MKKENIERYEIKKKILEIKGEELFEKAKEIWKEKVGFDKWSKWKRFWFNSSREPYFSEIKNIQMELLNKETEEALQ